MTEDHDDDKITMLMKISEKISNNQNKLKVHRCQTRGNYARSDS